MNRLTIIASLIIAAAVPLTSAGAGPDHADKPKMKHHDAPKPINRMCPVGKEPIDPEAGTFMYKGHAIGICCPSCSEEFMAWDEKKRDEFVALALAHKEPGEAHKAVAVAAKKAPAWSDPYPLGTCPVSGEPLGEMGDPIVKKYNGREIRFCCKKCVGKFEKDLKASMKKVDEAIIKDQMRYYPLQTCPVSGEPLTEDGEDKAVNFVYGNRLVRLCCNMCKKKFKANPQKYIAALDKAAADAQRKDYPLNTCPVSGEQLGEMGDPVEVVVAGRLVRLCCNMCKPKIMANPKPFLDKIDAAWQAKGKYMPEADEHHDMDDDMHGVNEMHHDAHDDDED